jgi:tetratricopeptide (TPR) repeat protein
MHARTRIVVLVFLAATAAAGATVGLTALTSDPEPARVVICPHGPGLQLDLGVRADPEAVALRRAQQRLTAGDTRGARAIFARYHSVDGQVGAAVAAWPQDTLTSLRALGAQYPHNGTVALYLGSALYCDGQAEDGRRQWQAAKRLAPDSSIGVRASDLLNPRFPPGIPVFVPSFRYPPAVASLAPPRQLQELARRAARPDVRAELLYGVALQELGRQLSAERQYAAAARLAPSDPEARVAAAVGRFDKDRPSDAFSRLGPLARRFPRSATVRFHLGLLLIWLGQVDAAKTELRRAQRLAPRSTIGKEAAKFLAQLSRIGSSSAPSR